MFPRFVPPPVPALASRTAVDAPARQSAIHVAVAAMTGTAPPATAVAASLAPVRPAAPIRPIFPRPGIGRAVGAA